MLNRSCGCKAEWNIRRRRRLSVNRPTMADEMPLRSLLTAFLVWVLYPAWLLAGAADYLCHRRTDIAHTSGVIESVLHVAQFLCIAAILTLAVAFPVTALTWAAMFLAAVAHSVLSYIDVA